MARFTTRVELHYATEADYQVLHSAMELRGFSRLVGANDGRRYHLPPAEYDLSGTASINDVLQGAQSAIAEIHKTGAVLVTEAVRRSWVGLRPA